MCNPSCHPAPHTPIRLLRSLSRTRRNANDWRHDPLHHRYLDEATALAATDVASAQWADLVEIPTQAARLVDLVAQVRIGYLPAAAAGIIRLRLVVRALGADHLLQDLTAHAPTLTREANDALSHLAAVVREDNQLRHAFADLEGDELLAYVQTNTSAIDFAQGLATFLAHYGHRETASILLLREPTWVDDPRPC
ncbi:hypothetical protein [Ornithinimicrobium sp. INDO-MA30-4]|uniref:hypothetical protein n=1 Tax=Ornithinimicrobium sp. INDO-MA30-4 TaxID=2908651 RepID=UPI001F317760|nr:hypothetical protein [Ornithinimicrobium sp. INDO-MA30-4]UJH70134.1 hypothetical protein L0A91_13170 [Ornithinimicrobium sp. INDO-MA30-4]